jgi:hypothetical protein
MEFLEKNGKLVASVFFGFIVIGLVWAFVSNSSKHNEEQTQDKLAKIELDYTKYKEDLVKSKTAPTSKDDKKTAVDKKNEEKTLAEANENVVKLRSLLTASLNQFISENKKSIATEMASLYLSEILLDEKKSVEALDVLKKTTSDSNNLTSILIQKKKFLTFAKEKKYYKPSEAKAQKRLAEEFQNLE